LNLRIRAKEESKEDSITELCLLFFA